MISANGIDGLSSFSRLLLSGARTLPGALGGDSCFRKFVRRNRGRPYEIGSTRGFRFAGELGDSVDNRIAIQLDYEPALSDFVARKAAGAAGILDIGCNVGWFSCLAASVAGSDCRILAVDANPRMVESCRRNMALNGFACETMIRAVGPERGQVTFHIPENRHSRASIGIGNTERFGATRKLEVEMVLIADLLERFPDGRCDLIKMDIEGYELVALRAASRETMRKVGTIVLEYAPRNLEGCGFAGMTLEVLPWLEDFAVSRLDEEGGMKPVERVSDLGEEETTLILENRNWPAERV